MSLKRKIICRTVAVLMMAPMLNGCIALALAPAALNLAAEGISVHATGQTITENLRDVIKNKEEENNKETVEIASNNFPGLPPRKPTPPAMKSELVIKGPAVMVGDF